MSIAAKLAVGMMRAAYAPIRLFPQKNKIAILSRQSNKATEDVRELQKYFSEKYPQIRVEVLVRMVGGITYPFHMLRQMYAIATSKVVIVDGYCITASVLRHKKGTRIIQMWHSSAAIKKFGYQTLDRPSGHSSELAEIMCMHRNYDYVICPSMATGELFAKAFNVDKSRLKLLGLPRLSRISDPESEWVKEKRQELGLDDGREVVLYLPTFRKGSRVQVEPLAEALDSERFHLVVKAHPLDTLEGDVDTGRPYNSTQWLKLADRIITDYSALGVEASILGKPLYFYVYDIDEYEETTGLNINPLRDMSWCSSQSAEELAELIEGDYDFDSLHSFREKYIEVPTDNCTERLAEFILEILNGNN